MTTFNATTGGLEVVQEFADRVKGKTIVITGASQNTLGGETAISLAHGQPGHLILLGRSQPRVDPVMSKIREIDSSIKVDFVPVTLDDLDSVRSAAAAINASISQLDILINNAGIMAVPEYTVSKGGVEMQLATNHLGHFLFTKLLFPKIVAAGPGARIVNLTSLGHKMSPFRFDDYNFSNGKEYDPWSAYGQSKTANVLFSLYLADKLRDRGIVSFSVHPGSIMTQLGTHLTDMEAEFRKIAEISLKNTGRPFPYNASELKSMDQGVATTLVAALDPRIEAQSGMWMKDCQPTETYEYAQSAEGAEKLWKLSEELVGEKWEL